ncbi:MAG: hypothetical protein LBE34_06715 [Flavobacteriaceae bacterium]|jgi:hypothetical protein|nr:hypothetical protein [Flavobacteriaceae bacterium]
MADNTFLGRFVTQYAQLVLPLKEALQDEASCRALFLDLGWSIPNPPINQAQAVVNKITVLSNNLKNLSSSPSEVDMISLLFDITQVYTSVQSFVNAIANTTTGIAPAQNIFKNEFPEDLFNYLICSYLNRRFEVGLNTFLALKIIEYSTVEAVNPRPSYTKIKIDYSKLGTLITNPMDVIKSVTSWGTTEYNFDTVATLIMDFLSSVQVSASYSNRVDINQSIGYGQIFDDNSDLGYSVRIFLMDLLIGNEYKTLLANLSSFEGDTTDQKGMVLEVDVPEGTNLKQDITDTISLELNTSNVIGNRFAVQFSPSQQKFSYLSNPSTNGRIELLVKNEFKEPKIIFGQKAGTRLELRRQIFSFFVDPGDSFEFGLGYDLSGLSLVIDPENSDNFIKKVFGDKSKEIAFPIMMQWSSVKGISFLGSGSFEFKVNTHLKVGPIEFTDIKVAIQAPKGKDQVIANIGTNVKGDLGVVSFSIDNIGLKLTFDLKESNAGPFGIGIGFKPPTGVGLSIDAPPVKGGGFLNYDEATSTYTGGLELKFSKISFSAIGIISTKLPGGESGYSLLVIISVEFTPLQLGMGFTLNGIGGLMGLNRTSNPDFLRSGIRYNTLEHILFPKDIVKNSNAIISNVSQAFPIRKNQFVVGPMVKIGWGTPALLTIDLGIVIELPDPLRLLILGILRAQLPSSDNAILKLQVNFLGIIDFKEKYLSFDASLYDSKVVGFALYGDMALRMHWGSKPNFLLSVGGFHPAYTPPPLNLPSMQRLTIVLANSNNLQISVETYFAVTSNSAQFGASVYAMARAWKIMAIGQLWFNVLFQFSPFYFNADMGVKFAIKMGSKTIMGLYIVLRLEGPDPWRAQGYGTFKILFVRVRIRFDSTFGRQRSEAIEAVEIDSKIKEILLLRENWESVLPDRNHQLVSWRKEEINEELSVDPAGAIKISQKMIPLNTLMQKYSSSAISDFNKYTIRDVSINGVNLPIERVQDYFARNEFSHMKDDDKLSKEGYELFDSGVIVGSGNSLTSQYAVHKLCAYEEVTLDSGYRRQELDKYILLAKRMRIENMLDYTTFTDLSRAKIATISSGPSEVKLSVREGEFVFANRNNLQQVATNLSFTNTMDAEYYLEQQRIHSPEQVSDWIIANRYELIN